MPIEIDLPAAQETRLLQEAQKEGITPGELIQRTLAERYPVDAGDAAALELIERWISEAPTDPERQQDAEDDLLDFQRAINETRRSAGAQPVYPGTGANRFC